MSNNYERIIRLRNVFWNARDEGPDELPPEGITLSDYVTHTENSIHTVELTKADLDFVSGLLAGIADRWKENKEIE